jgi:hypothetical protein
VCGGVGGLHTLCLPVFATNKNHTDLILGIVGATTVIPGHYFSICDAADTGEETEPDDSQFPVHNLPEHSSSANLAAHRHIGHSKPAVTASEVLNKISPFPSCSCQ